MKAKKELEKMEMAEHQYQKAPGEYRLGPKGQDVRYASYANNNAAGINNHPGKKNPNQHSGKGTLGRAAKDTKVGRHFNDYNS